MLLSLASCAPKPPVQAMAEARAAVQSLRGLEQDDRNSQAYRYYKSAEQSLRDAAEAMDHKQYAKAKQKAKQAKRQAQLAAKLK